MALKSCWIKLKNAKLNFHCFNFHNFISLLNKSFHVFSDSLRFYLNQFATYFLNGEKLRGGKKFDQQTEFSRNKKTVRENFIFSLSRCMVDCVWQEVLKNKLFFELLFVTEENHGKEALKGRKDKINFHFHGEREQIKEKARTR